MYMQEPKGVIITVEHLRTIIFTLQYIHSIN